MYDVRYIVETQAILLRVYEIPHYLTILYHAIEQKDKAQKRINKIFQDSKLEGQREYIKELAKRLGFVKLYFNESWHLA